MVRSSRATSARRTAWTSDNGDRLAGRSKRPRCRNSAPRPAAVGPCQRTGHGFGIPRARPLVLDSVEDGNPAELTRRRPPADRSPDRWQVRSAPLRLRLRDLRCDHDTGVRVPACQRLDSARWRRCVCSRCELDYLLQRESAVSPPEDQPRGGRERLVSRPSGCASRSGAKRRSVCRERGGPVQVLQVESGSGNLPHRTTAVSGFAVVRAVRG